MHHFLVKILVWCFVAVMILSFLNFYLAIRPTKFVTDITPKKLGFEYEKVSFKTSDGINLKGWFVPTVIKTDKTIIICHGYPADKNNIFGALYFLLDKYNLFLFDFRYLGESEGKYSTIGYHEKKDFIAAIDWLKGRNYTKLGAMGFSLGAATILMTNSKDIKAIVADSSFANIDKMMEHIYFLFPGITKTPFVWLTKLYAYLFLRVNLSEISPLDEISKINVPILLIHGDKDTQILVENSKLLYEASDKSNTELWIVQGADHGLAHYYYKQEYEKKVMDFFGKNIM